MPFILLLTAVLAMAIYMCSRRSTGVHTKTYRLPPGPSGLPFLGMLLYMPKNPVHKITQLSKRYGGIYSLKMARQRYVVIADAEIAQELLVSRAAMTSSREASYIASKTLWSGMGVIASPHSEIWKKHRLIIQRALRTQSVESATDAIQGPLLRLREKLTAGLLDAQALQLAFSEYSLENFSSMLLGPNHSKVPEPLFREILGMMNEMLSLMIPMGNKEDFFTLLQYLPTSSYCRARQWRSRLVTTISVLLEHVEPKDGSPTSSFGRKLIQMEADGKIDVFEMCSLSMVWMVAAHASFPGFLSSFIKSVSTSPEVQQRAQEEIAQSRETDILPQFNERKLPYCRAVLMEAMRCNGASIDSPHLVTEDITLGQHIIPAGTALVLDKWTINHDERFKEAMAFEPSRHLQGAYADSKGVASKNFWIFGTGRRICPAVALSDHIAFSTIVKLLQTLDITTTSESELTPFTVQCKLREA